MKNKFTFHISLFTILFSLSSVVCFSQNNKIDSLLQALKNYDAKKIEMNRKVYNNEGDSVKVNILNALSRQYRLLLNFNNAKKNAEAALLIAQQINYKSGIIKSHNNIGLIDYYQGNYPEALKNYFASLYISEETGALNSQSAAYNNIGLIYTNQGNYAEALRIYFKSLTIDKQLGNKTGIAASYNNIGNIYEKQGNYSAALSNYQASLKLWQEAGDKKDIADALNNIGVIYSDLKRFSEALIKFNDALKLYTESRYQDGLAAAFINIGSTKLKMLKAEEARNWLTKGLTLAKEIGSVEKIKTSYELLTRVDSLQGNFIGAFENYKLYIIYHDSLVNVENTKKATQLQMQYEFDKKEAETKAFTDAELKKQKLLRNGFVGGFAVVLLFAGVFFYQRNKIQKEKLRAEKEKKNSDDLLLNILPGEVADEIKNTGSAKAKAFTMVTVMFTDFKDFTTISEKVSAELLVEEIHLCFSAFDNILQKYKIEKIKTIGDAYMCASGLPVSNITHAEDMIRAAFEIRDFILRRKKEAPLSDLGAFELRIGIHTGPVVAGVVGVKKFAYDIWGDTVNTASRMESSGEAGKVNISGRTYELVKDKFKCTYRGKIQAKNKGEIDMYFVEPVS